MLREFSIIFWHSFKIIIVTQLPQSVVVYIPHTVPRNAALVLKGQCAFFFSVFQVINSFKGGTLPFCLALMKYSNNYSMSAYLITALHGSYGLLWCLKVLAPPSVFVFSLHIPHAHSLFFPSILFSQTTSGGKSRRFSAQLSLAAAWARTGRALS